MEVKLKDSTFRKLKKVFYELTGIELKEKKYLVENRLAKYIGEDRAYKTYEEFYEAVLKDKTGEVKNLLVQSLVTNYTFFFRDPIHFAFVRWYIRNFYNQQEYLHIWSNGCSTGEEAYSIVISALLEKPDLSNEKFKVLATDVSKENIQKAIKGTYESWKMSYVKSKKNILHGFFQYHSSEDFYIVKPQVRSFVYFRILNVLSPYPFTKEFDIVFLRNVLIYFDQSEREEIINKIYHFTKRNGYLVLGLSENLIGITSPFKPLKYSIYKKT
ncbi:MAG: protein-glutamate O-methyltransferase CheR [Leptospiraceae bacterium]|nr:protein-glutamate O-methyltransferase CheR [Leptospiraceae bacterium]MDW7975223.1 protein-glutamate O-methyltransferase CheR [Leptospiraceae bacterium]